MSIARRASPEKEGRANSQIPQKGTAMSIKISNESKVQELLDEANSKCTARILSYQDIIDACNACDKHLSSIGLAAKAAKEGLQVYIDPHRAEYNKYKYHKAGWSEPMTTQAVISFEKGCWRLERVFRNTTASNSFRFLFSDNQKDRIIARLSTI